MSDLNAMMMHNTEYFGFGVETGIGMPCPFCAAKGWLRSKILDLEKAMEKETVCANCKRGAKAIFNRSATGTTFEIVQTQGPNPPAWMPAPRRV